MLSACTHQAAGLLTLNERQSPRILSVVQHGDELAELPFLWRLCLACTTLGFTVTVLDATIGESKTHRAAATASAGDNACSAHQQLDRSAVQEGLAQLSFVGTNHQRGWHQLTIAFLTPVSSSCTATQNARQYAQGAAMFPHCCPYPSNVRPC